MKYITIIIALTIGSMAFAQKGKSGHGEKGMNNDKPNREKLSDVNHEKMRVSNDRFNVATVDQGHKGNNQGPKNHGGKAQHQKPQGGHSGNGSFKTNNHQPRMVVQQQKGHGNKGNKSHKMNQPNKGKHVVGHPSNPSKGNYYKGKPGKGQKMHYGKGNKVHYSKGHPNFGYLYVNTPGYYSHRNYGQWRSEQAHKKHKKYHPIYEYQAVEGFNFIVVRNNFLYTETRNKIVLARGQLFAQRQAGTITVVEYDNSMQRVYVLEERRAAVELNVRL